MMTYLKSGYLSHPQQAYTLRRTSIIEGPAKGSDLIEIVNCCGLQLDLLPDAGLDIGQLRFKGHNISWISKNGYDTPARLSPFEDEFMRTFPGGLLYTCGLRNTGAACRDQGEWQPMHGRYHSHAADHISTMMEKEEICIQGIVRETALFGPAFEVRRTIQIPVFGSEITVSDEITNLSHSPQEFALLYHCNFGWPFVTKHTELKFPKDHRTTPRTSYAKTLLGQECFFSDPHPNEEEAVFFHENMKHEATLFSHELGIGMTLTWSDTLPILAQWRSMSSGDYVCGLEPTNCYIMGRSSERENGTLPVLQPFNTVHTKICFSFWSDCSQIAENKS